jgi:ferric-dicitrate binding protein FerR (iron transport regulator)
MELPPDIEDILLKDLNNQDLTEAENEALQIWLNESHKNENIYAQMKLAYLSPSSEDLNKIRNEIFSDIQRKIKPTQKTSREFGGIGYYWFRAAAIVVFSFTLAFILFQLRNKGQEEIIGLTEVQMVGKVSQPGQKITTSLPDGTLVKLNGDSKILYAEHFSGGTREVILYGEAFFDVVRDESKPFVIKTKDIQVQVMGTSFNIKSYPGNETSIVSVESGKVAVTDLVHQTMALFPGEKISYNSDFGTMNKDQFNWEVEYGWKDNILVFHEDTLDEILERLGKWYGVELKQEGEFPNWNKSFSGRYNNPTLKAVLEGLSYVYDFNYAIGTDTVILNNKLK